MSYWHIVDALYVVSFLAIQLGWKSPAETGSDVYTKVAAKFLATLFTAYLVRNIWPDLAGMAHSLSMCHG